MPNVAGMYLEEAQPQVAAVGMNMQVTDSTFSNTVPLGTIVEQVPSANSHAKKNRTLYVVVNARCRRQVAVPDLHDMSYRQAEASLLSMGIRVSDQYEYEPSEYKDLVLDVKQNGRALQPGERIDEGSIVTLVIGFGKGTEMEYDDAQEAEAVNEPVVYSQSPASGEQLLEGSMVNLKLSTNVEKALTTQGQESEEDFF